jgi:hypothetical protein
MSMNPEFQRNLWLEASPRRMAWAGVTLALIYGAAAVTTQDLPGATARTLGGVGAAVFVICGMLWGSRAAAGSVLGEIADRTWDFQRLSALTPWSMTWGKLFGAASLAWLCALSGLAFLLLAGLSRGLGGEGLAGAVFMLAAAVLLQAVSLGSALVGVRKARAEGRVARAGGVLGGLIAAVILLSAVASSEGFQHGLGVNTLANVWTAHGFVDWWWGAFPAAAFRAAAFAAFAAWALAGVWRLMRLELQMQNTPVVWPAFLIYLALFTAGFAVGSGGLAGGFLVAALVIALSAYAAAFAEPADRIRLRQFAQAAAKGAWSRAAPRTPAALFPAALAALLVVFAFVFARGQALTGEGPNLWQAAALIAFMTRDLGVIALFRFGPRPQRGDFGAVVALALLYFVGAIIGRGVGGAVGASLFAPLPDAPAASLVSGAVQAAVAWWLAVRRIKTPEASAAASA